MAKLLGSVVNMATGQTVVEPRTEPSLSGQLVLMLVIGGVVLLRYWATGQWFHPSV